MLLCQLNSDLPRGTSAAIPPSTQRFKSKGDALAATDTERDDTTFQAIALHGMEQSRCQHGAARPDRVPVGDCAAFDIHDVFRQTELAVNGDRDGSERFVDLDAIDILDRPSGPI